MAKDVKVTFRGDDKVSPVLAGIQARLQSWGASVKAVLTGIGVGLGAGALGAFFKSAVQEAAQASLENQQLAQSVRNLGLDYDRLAPTIEAAVDATRRLTTYSAGDLRGALTTLITLSGNVRGSLQNLTLVADVAAARHMDLASAAELVGKVMAGNTEILKKQGIEVQAGANAIDLLRTKFKGFAEGEASTLSGQLKQLVTQWGEVKEAVGRAIAGTEASGQPVRGFTQLLIDLEAWVTRNERAFGRLANVLAGTVGVAIRVGVIAPVNLLTTALEGLGALVDTLAVGFLQMAQRLQGIFGAILRQAGVALEAAGVSDVGKSLQATGDQIVLEAAKERARLQQELDAALQARYARGNITPGTFNATPTGNGPPGGGGVDTAKELQLIQERVRGNRESAEDRARLADLERQTRAELELQTLSIEQRLALEQRLSAVLAARQQLTDRNTGNTVIGQGNLVPGMEGNPNGENALVAAAQGAQLGFTADDLGRGVASGNLQAVDELAAAWNGVLDPIRQALDLTQRMDQVMGQLAGGALLAVADGLANVAANAFTGANVDGPIKMVKRLVSETAKAEGQLAIRKGVVKIADSFFPFNPAQLASGLKLVAAGTALSGLGGLAGGGGGAHGGGGGISPGGFQRNAAAAAESRKSKGIIVISDGVMHTRSPEFRDMITTVVKEAAELGELTVVVQ